MFNIDERVLAQSDLNLVESIDGELGVLQKGERKLFIQICKNGKAERKLEGFKVWG